MFPKEQEPLVPPTEEEPVEPPTEGTPTPVTEPEPPQPLKRINLRFGRIKLIEQDDGFFGGQSDIYLKRTLCEGPNEIAMSVRVPENTVWKMGAGDEMNLGQSYIELNLNGDYLRIIVDIFNEEPFRTYENVGGTLDKSYDCYMKYGARGSGYWQRIYDGDDYKLICSITLR